PPPQADVVYLGFGEDGHVASLFPSGPELAARHLGLVAAAAPVAPVARISLTMPTLK
ncbi:MAG: 6-phosphogluconolactonase, partial [Alphaproteobacteria bacterium]